MAFQSVVSGLRNATEKILSAPVKLQYIYLENFTLGFSEAAKDSELIEEMQLLLRNAGCQVSQVDGLWSANFAAAIGTFATVHEVPVIEGISPQLASELLAYREQIRG